VRVEELINYFSYEYPPPSDGQPFSIHTEACRCPWNESHILARIGLRGKEIPEQKRPPANLVFLIDVSGSMQPFNKLPLLKRALAMLVDRLDRRDKVSIVVYAGASGLVHPATRCDAKAEILQAIEGLGAGGSTNGGAGIELAYRIATREFISGGVNRVILATDGDFNVGVTSEGALTRLIVDKAKSGVYLSVLGVGMGNFKDSTLEKLADKGNGNYAYIDTLNEARKVLVEQMGSTLVTIAQDVKIQVEFNPTTVGAYRLIGYENRLLAPEDFNDDSKDAGEIGTGHTVTALYEIVPPEAVGELARVDRLKYQKKEGLTGSATNDELFTVKLRFKKPGQENSALVSRVVANAPVALGEATSDTRFAAAVAGFAMLLRKSENSGALAFNDILGLARESLGPDPYSRRSQFIELVEKAKKLKSQ
jgi:Ca-activated chloride channel family protein